MAKTTDIPRLLLEELQRSDVEFTVKGGAIYYHSVEDYILGQKIISLLEKQLPAQGYNKYGNRKVKLRILADVTALGMENFDYVTFDSEDEAEYYYYLLDKQSDGEVTKISLHPRLILFPAFRIGSVKYNPIIYTPDFYVEYVDGRREYVDIKGMSTEAGDLRRKLYLERSTNLGCDWYGVPLQWIATSHKYGDDDGWIDYDELQKIRAKNRKEKKGA